MADTIYGDGGEDVLIGGPGGDRIDGGSERDLIFGDNVRLDRTIGDGTANARYRTLTGAEGGQIYSTLPGTAGTVLVNSGFEQHPGRRAGLGGLQHPAPRPRPDDADSGRQQLRQRLHRRRSGRRPDLRRARQRRDPGRRLDRPGSRRDAPRRRHAVGPALGRSGDRRRRLHRGQRRQRCDLRQPRPGRHHRRQLEPVQPDDRTPAAGRRRPDLRRRRHRHRAQRHG